MLAHVHAYVKTMSYKKNYIYIHTIFEPFSALTFALGTFKIELVRVVLMLVTDMVQESLPFGNN